MTNLKNKKILITGGSSGLGASLAKKLKSAGANVMILALDDSKLAATAAQIGCDYIACDLRDLGQCKRAAAAVKAKFGSLDILVNNAGIWTDEGVEAKNPTRVEDTINTNVVGPIYLTNQFLDEFKSRNSGTIFFTNSVSGRFPITDVGANAYVASKFGLFGYAEALKSSLKNTNIKIIQLHPCGFDTDIFESSGWPHEAAHNQPWMTSTENIANAAMFALSAPTGINISTVVVDKIAE
ncbi:MAG: SDR family oxidoreductase [Alphaproteobacteria bacterium]|nr:SDR family oxidoreductase [Alphaproteobacteria bacterium]